MPERTMTVEQNVLQQHSQKVRLHKHASLRARLRAFMLTHLLLFPSGFLLGTKEPFIPWGLMRTFEAQSLVPLVRSAMF